MTDSNSNFVDPNTDDLDAFNDLLHGQAEEQPEPEATEQEEETSEEEVEDSVDNEVDDEEDTDLADETPEEEPKEKPKSRFQERINELTHKAREAERENDRLKDLLSDAIARLDAKSKPEPEVQPNKGEKDGPPSHDEKNEDGSDKYPLGEFDPAYLRDYSRYVVRKEHEAIQREDAEKAEQEAAQKAQQELVGQWNDKLNTAVETKYPDMLDKTALIEDTFRDLPEDYGSYLAATIMQMDYGPDVLYYLAENLDEAKAIAQSGAARATVALGRLEARFALQDEDNKQQRLKVSKAPTPPERVNKGTSVSQDVPDDTDDLDAFEAKLFRRKR